MDEPLPEGVERALATARRLGFATTRAEAATGQPSCSLPAAGRLLAMLAAGCARVCEIGTGAGCGAAWIASALPKHGRLWTIEQDGRLAAAVRELFGHDERVSVLHGDANVLAAANGPYDLVFADGGFREPGQLVDLLRVGGFLVMDDVTPVARLPEDSPFHRGDPKRALFMQNPRLRSVEVVFPDLENAALVGRRIA